VCTKDNDLPHICRSVPDDVEFNDFIFTTENVASVMKNSRILPPIGLVGYLLSFSKSWLLT